MALSGKQKRHDVRPLTGFHGRLMLSANQAASPVPDKQRRSQTGDNAFQDEKFPCWLTGYRTKRSGAVLRRPKPAVRAFRKCRHGDATGAAPMQARRATTRVRLPDPLRYSDAHKRPWRMRYPDQGDTKRVQLTRRVRTASATNVAQQFTNAPARLWQVRAHRLEPFFTRAFTGPRTDNRRRTNQSNSRRNQ